MRYQPAHAAKSGSVPFMLRGPKSVRTVLSAAVAGAIAFAPAVLISAPAQAAPLAGFTFADNSISTTEGGDLVFELVRTADASPLSSTNLTWTVSTGTGPTDATVDEDYTDVGTGTVTFAADNSAPYGGDSQFLTVQTLQDTLDENVETFTLTVTDTNGDTLEAEGRISDDDAAPHYALFVDDPSPSEDINGGVVNITAELDAISGKDVTIPVTVTPGTAKLGAAQDYTFTPGSITIPAGTNTSTSLSISIVDDDLYEESGQTLTVQGGTNASVTGTDSAPVTIMDDEEQPEIDVASTTVAEGGTLAFGATLSGPSERPVTATWTAADGPGSDAPNSTHGTAKAGSDYTAATGTVTFPAATSNTTVPGNTAQTISVKTVSDQINEDDEDMHVVLTNPTIATIGDAQATGSITDNDPLPTATLSPTTDITEGNGGRTAKTYTVKLNRESGQTVTVNYDVRTGGGSATEVEDFFATSGKLTFKPGELSKTFTVDVVGDNVDEPGNSNREDFEIALSSSTADVTNNGTAGVVSVNILDDDATPTFTVAPITMQEGDTSSVVVFPVKLSNPSDTATTFTLTDVPGSATNSGNDPGDIDYDLVQGTVTIPARQTTGYLYFLVTGDDVYETNEQMKVTLAPSGNITAGNKDANLTILNDDDAPSLEVVSAVGEEGDTVNVMGVVTGTAQDDTVFNINFAGSSVNGSTAASVNDFTNPGTVSKTVDGGTLSGSPVMITSLDLLQDTTPEGPETILASGNAVNGSVVNGVITIAASDGGTPAPAPTLASSASFRLGVGSLRLSGTAAAGQTVTLWGTPIGAPEDKAWQNLGTTTANSNGGYVFFPRFTTTGWWFRTAVGDQQSNAVKVYLKEDPDFFTRSYSKGTATLIAYGDPRVAGLSVRFLRANSNGTWSTVGTGVLDANGKFSKTLTGLKSGASYLYKATIYGDGDVGLMTNTSVSSRIRVR
ncbi:Calx-beta domain-containing protein [Nucisporomicrobium flavum]|uniref:Calx-beta domain-containing protein n=1 Tax=Nucisporomicrobium flavum TaxID=2785915 RepID=UPI0018F48315|nr:Calx-beta domain-containing protein [Nucisporomicrobium flavum]